MSLRSLVLLFIVALSACQAPEPHAGNGVVSERSWPLSQVNRLVVSGPVSVQVMVGPAFEPSLRIEGDGNLVDSVRRSEDGRTLSLDANGLSPSLPLNVTVTTTALVTISAANGAVVTTNVMRGGRLSIEARASARVLANGVDGDSLVLDVSRGASIDAAGVVRLVEATASDVGVLALSSLRARVALVSATELSTVTVNASEALRGSATRSSHLVVTGAPLKRLVTVDESSAVQSPPKTDVRAESPRARPEPG
ncbi:MAG: DUF2807 domain-containing protein [Myxococcales bacterium]|nr:DUF2807 domain-containing protein [Myxococcales bacterium]